MEKRQREWYSCDKRTETRMAGGQMEKYLTILKENGADLAMVSDQKHSYRCVDGI
ncbi:MAG: hypothetical protein LUB63_00910 [Oscillospiraceae bacterium]|nr:hypothetical protein [Oscillospiraceae bacterium]